MANFQDELQSQRTTPSHTTIATERRKYGYCWDDCAQHLRSAHGTGAAHRRVRTPSRVAQGNQTPGMDMKGMLHDLAAAEWSNQALDANKKLSSIEVR